MYRESSPGGRHGGAAESQRWGRNIKEKSVTLGLKPRTRQQWSTLKEFVIHSAVKAITTKIKQKPRPTTDQIDSKPHAEDLQQKRHVHF